VTREEARNQLRLAAIERRLEVHQQAYVLWAEMMSSVHDREIHDVVARCQDFWKANCLYLEPVSRRAFKECYSTASIYANCIRDHESPDRVQKEWKSMNGLGEVLARGVNLPSIGELEASDFKPANKNSKSPTA
jgi:hypothetical protein